MSKNETVVFLAEATAYGVNGLLLCLPAKRRANQEIQVLETTSFPTICNSSIQLCDTWCNSGIARFL